MLLLFFYAKYLVIWLMKCCHRELGVVDWYCDLVMADWISQKNCHIFGEPLCMSVAMRCILTFIARID